MIKADDARPSIDPPSYWTAQTCKKFMGAKKHSTYYRCDSESVIWSPTFHLWCRHSRLCLASFAGATGWPRCRFLAEPGFSSIVLAYGQRLGRETRAGGERIEGITESKILKIWINRWNHDESGNLDIWGQPRVWVATKAVQFGRSLQGFCPAQRGNFINHIHLLILVG